MFKIRTMYSPKWGTRKHRNQERKRGIFREFPCFWKIGELPGQIGNLFLGEYTTKLRSTCLVGKTTKTGFATAKIENSKQKELKKA